MRGDVLELMAEEVAGRPVDALASFTTWDDGRRKLDGMAKGRRWDLDREHRAFEKDTLREIRRLMKMRARHRRPEVYRAWHRRYEAANKARRRELRIKRYWKDRDRRLAKQRAQYQKHRDKRKAECLANYYKNRNARATAFRAWYDKQPRKGTRTCSVCGEPGHNSRRHQRAAEAR